MTDEHAPTGLLARLRERLRARAPKQPRWRHFAPHAAAAPVLAVVVFFVDPATNATGQADLYYAISIPLLLTAALWPPLSLLLALWKWYCTMSWRGAIWLLRPALLALVPLMLVTVPLRDWGQTWDFERNLAERNRIVQQVLDANSGPMGEHEYRVVVLSDEFRHLSWNGTVTLYGQQDGKSVDFQTHNGRYEYHTREREALTPRHKRYDGHWWIFTW